MSIASGLSDNVVSASHAVQGYAVDSAFQVGKCQQLSSFWDIGDQDICWLPCF